MSSIAALGRKSIRLDQMALQELLKLKEHLSQVD
jgi:hypothetical protein